MDKPWWRHDIVMSALAVASVGLVYWFEEGNLGAAQRDALLLLDLLLVVLFVADWGLSYKQATDRKRYVWGNWWKLLGMVPLYVSALGFLRLLRLIRIVYALDLIPPVHRFLVTLRSMGQGTHLAPLAGISGGITFTGAALVWLAERNHNPRLTEFSEAIWWAIVTVTTVGYGDITPQTSLGRAVAVLLMVTGIGTIGLLASQVSAALIRHKGGSQDGVAGELQQLATLHSEGKLTDEEFAAAKARLLQ